VTSKPHKVAFYADIFYNSPLSPPYWIPPRDLDVEAILLGGDIHYRPDGLGEMLREIRATQHDATWLIVVPGNGEYAHQELGESRRQYREAVESVPGAVFLDDQAVVLPSGLRVIGSTLWSLIADDEIDSYTGMLTAEGLQGVDDIRVGDRFLTLRDTNELHLAARSFLAGQLRSLSEAERGQTIVCTHFWPTLRPFAGRPGVPDEEWYQVFGSDLDSLITECGPRIWLCGHVHITYDVTIGSTLVSSNPRAGDGPQIINPDFREFYVVEL
jgi:hypothetical protein